MSKIGRKPISTKDIKIDIQGNTISFKGKKESGIYELPDVLKVEVLKNDLIKLTCDNASRENNKIWGLHRALLANKLHGAELGFDQKIIITGLGFKGVVSGNKIDFSLGYSHKINFPLPEGITVEVDKTGQNLTVRGTSKEVVGLVSSKIRALRPPEPYKGTGIKLGNETILRKAGKTKSA